MTACTPQLDFKTLESHSVIQKNATIAIYGAGVSERATKQYLSLYRPDIRILFFMDTFKTGTLDGLDIVPLDKFEPYSKQIDLIIIASAWWKEILKAFVNRWNVPVAVAAKPLWDKNQYNTNEVDMSSSALLDMIDAAYQHIHDKQCTKSINPYSSFVVASYHKVNGEPCDTVLRKTTTGDQLIVASLYPWHGSMYANHPYGGGRTVCQSESHRPSQTDKNIEGPPTPYPEIQSTKGVTCLENMNSLT